MTNQKSTPSTQKFVEVKEVKNGVVFLKSGGLRKILAVNGINFDLKSDQEQQLILNSFQSFLNGVDFPVQFFIHSRKANVENYLAAVNDRYDQERNELLKIQIEKYVEFIKSLIEEFTIIEKGFFVVVPYDPLYITKKTEGLLSFFKKKGGDKEKGEDIEMEKNVEQLDYRVSEIVSGLNQIGLDTSPLDDDSLIELFYNLYNPQLIEKKGMEIPLGDQD